jgi:hypothetical protein
MVSSGNFKGKAVKHQIGETDGGTLQIVIDMALKDSAGESAGTMSTFLFFTEKSATYSFERLRALGWKGNGADDIEETLNGIYDNEVSCTVDPPTQYKDQKDGSTKMGVAKLNIDIGAGTVTLNKPLDANTFKARLAAIGGGGKGAAPATGGGTPPPF